MSSGRTERAKYQLRTNLPHQDYRRQLEGPPISRRAIYMAATKETTQEKTDRVSGMEQLLALLTDQFRQQQEERQQEREYHRQQEEEHQQEKEYCQQKEQQEEDYHRWQQEEQRQEMEYYRQREQWQEERRQLMQEQMLEAMKVRQPTMQPHVNMAPFEENEDIQDFLEAFEGIMNI